jgi:hypothetical protein
MSLEQLLQQLGYEGSPTFLRRGDNRFETELGYGHIFRRARDPKSPEAPRWQAEGVYGIRESTDLSGRFTPIVYVCSAKDAAAAQDLHRLLWNQDVAPYILVHSVEAICVYSGFCYDEKGKTPLERGIIALDSFNVVQTIVDLFHRKKIDDGRLWQEPRLRVDASKRVHHRLLASLRQLDKDLQATTEGRDGLRKDVSHALIGKYVYLRYLRDRGILSDERLDKWELKASDIFGPKAKKTSLAILNEQLDNWLNGEIFPLPWVGEGAPTVAHVRDVAGAFHGEERRPNGIQKHLDFEAYDFSFIPIETLSLVYEQFLHIEEKIERKKPRGKKKKTKGREEGAYYTPLPLVNFMLAELERQRPLEKGMKIFDPSCGSGTFLVQAYRLLIEKTFPLAKPRPKPSELRDLLKESIFGCDVDGDACQVTQLSLLLTLLDYVQPPDLSGSMHAFRLPTMCETKDPEKLRLGHTPNILKRNFFEPGLEPALAEAVANKQSAKADWRRLGFDWIAGNPPWKLIKPHALGPNDKPVWKWMKTYAKELPIGLNQAAQAFVWQAPRYLKASGECILLVPAMGLFEEPSEHFRKTFFLKYDVHTVANFANLAEVLFEGRARVPAAAVSCRLHKDDHVSGDDLITVFSPFVVNQEVTCPQNEGERRKIWSLGVNSSEIRTLERREAASGSGLPWKLSMWGSPWDERLLSRLEKKWPVISRLEAPWDAEQKKFVPNDKHEILGISQGLELREEPESDGDSPIDFGNKDDWKTLENAKLDRLRNVFAFPAGAMAKLSGRDWYGRGKRVPLPFAICKPPHIILSAARTFAIYSDELVVVSPRHIGIVSCTQDAEILKALSLFLSSDFAFYHQFFCSTQLGVQRGRATLASLRRLPIPIVDLSRDQLSEWVELHARLVKHAPRRVTSKKTSDSRQGDLFGPRGATLEEELEKLNELTAQALELTREERALIHDLVKVRYALTDGKRGEAAMRAPTVAELEAYASTLKNELDGFVGDETERRHRVTVFADDKSAMVEIDFTNEDGGSQELRVLLADERLAKRYSETRERLLDKAHARQWRYFNRNLRIYRGRRTYMFKPFHLFHWTQGDALTDADQIIAETLAGS